MTSTLSLNPAFWQAESKCLLLSRNNGYLTSENAAQRCAQFSELLKFVKEPARYKEIAEAKAESSTGSAEFDRIFREDAIRTFTSETCREAEVNTLKKIYAHVKDYHQGLGFAVAFLRLFMSEEDVVTLCCYLNDSVCQGYYKLENEEYLKDAYVFDSLTDQAKEAFKLTDDQRYLEPLYRTCQRLRTYCFSGQFLSKWFIGLCIHVFPFEAIYELLRLILTNPEKKTWFKFAASLIAAASDDLARASGTPEMIKVLKFDSQLYPDDLTIEALRPSLFKDREGVIEDEDAAAAGDDDSEEDDEGGVRELSQKAEESRGSSAYVLIVKKAYDIEVDAEILKKAEVSVQAKLDEQKRVREAAAADDSDSFNFSDEE